MEKASGCFTSWIHSHSPFPSRELPSSLFPFWIHSALLGGLWGAVWPRAASSLLFWSYQSFTVIVGRPGYPAPNTLQDERDGQGMFCTTEPTSVHGTALHPNLYWQLRHWNMLTTKEVRDWKKRIRSSPTPHHTTDAILVWHATWRQWLLSCIWKRILDSPWKHNTASHCV